MKKTKEAIIYPMNLGLTKSQVPGTSDPKSLAVCKNIIINNRGSLKKFPGTERLDYIGKEGGVQAIIHFFATTGSGQASEVIRARKGRLEALRNNNMVDLGISFHPTDIVTFERFQNALIIHFENSPPYYYTINGTPTLLSLRSGHSTSPPRFSRVHHDRLIYGGRGSQPHRLTLSAINDIQTYAIASGGLQISVKEGDGDPEGLTGLSPTFKGDLFAFKYQNIYRMTLSDYGYAISTLTNEVGCVHHNTIVGTQDNVYFVSSFAIHSLTDTDRLGGAESSTVSYPIFEYFQDDVNWALRRNMIAVHDKFSNSYLLSYASQGSSVNNKILGFNLVSRQFFERESVEYPVIANYYDFGRNRTMVSDETHGIGILKDDVNTSFSEAISSKIRTNTIFPMNNPNTIVSFQSAVIFAKPTIESVESTFRYYIDGNLIGEETIDTSTNNTTYLGVESGVIGEAVIGSGLIGNEKLELIKITVPMSGSGSSIKFEIDHIPEVGNEDVSFEVYGIVYRFEYDEDTEDKVTL